jgi:hypothetical protein
MRTLCGLLGVWLASLACACGQVTVEVVLDQQQFLPGESLPIAVRVVNRSGQTLRLGDDDEWLAVAVMAREGGVVSRTGDLPVRGEFTLGSSQRATRRLDLAPYFNLARQGRYLVQATVRIAAWDQQFTSEPVSFDIISGSRVWEREFGVPNRAVNGAPEVRKYILQEANYLKRNLRLYLRLTDADETRIFRVLAIGPMVSFGKAEPQLDSRSNLHLLYQRGRASCSYTVINPDGDILVRQMYDITGSRPRLQLNAAGEITVVGGMRRFTEDDLPPREKVSDSAPPVPAGQTNEAPAARP